MPRSSDIYSKPAGTTAIASTTVESAKYNQTIDDLVVDANDPRPIVAGGTGAATAAAARTNLSAQESNANLTSIAGLTFAASKIIGSSGASTAVLLDAPAGDLVGTTATQTLTGKTLTSPTLTAPAINGTVTGGVVRADAVWETGTDTTPSMPTPANIAAAIAALVPSPTVSPAQGVGSAFGDIITWAHGLGSIPTEVGGYIQCNSAINGYAVGERINSVWFSDSGSRGFELSWDATNVYAIRGINPFVFGRDGVPTTTLIENANWDLYLWVKP